MTFSLLSETLEVKQIVLIVFNFLTQRNVSLNHPKLRFQNHKSRALSKQLHFPVLSFVFDVIWVYTPPTNLKNSHFAIIELTKKWLIRVCRICIQLQAESCWISQQKPFFLLWQKLKCILPFDSEIILLFEICLTMLCLMLCCSS